MGYSRAVLYGRNLAISGCVGIEPDGSYAPTLEGQTRRSIARVIEALAAFNLDLRRIVRLRIYTTRVEEWESIAAVLGPLFEPIRPANTLLGVAALVDPRALIEIEADAWLGLPDQ